MSTEVTYQYKFFRGSNGRNALWTVDEVQSLLREHGAQGWRLVKWEGSLVILERESEEATEGTILSARGVTDSVQAALEAFKRWRNSL